MPAWSPALTRGPSSFGFATIPMAGFVLFRFGFFFFFWFRLCDCVTVGRSDRGLCQIEFAFFLQYTYVYIYWFYIWTGGLLFLISTICFGGMVSEVLGSEWWLSEREF